MGLFFLLIMIALPLIAQVMVKSTFNKYSTVQSSRGVTAAQAARSILDSNGLYNIRIEKIAGDLTDHFSPTENVIRLSESVYDSTSVAAIGVAAHECGHACQHAENYAPIVLRSKIVPAVNICSRLWCIVFIIGLLIFNIFPALAYIGIILFSVVILFQIVTLPTEFDASNRALRTLESQGILEITEVPQAKKVLTAAAMTYVASLIASVMQLIRLISSVRK